jgi:hypothetical protein
MRAAPRRRGGKIAFNDQDWAEKLVRRMGRYSGVIFDVSRPGAQSRT